MPVRSAGIIDMVFDAGFQASRAKGAADINIETGFDKDGAELADVDRFFNSR